MTNSETCWPASPTYTTSYHSSSELSDSGKLASITHIEDERRRQDPRVHQAVRQAPRPLLAISDKPPSLVPTPRSSTAGPATAAEPTTGPVQQRGYLPRPPTLLGPRECGFPVAWNVTPPSSSTLTLRYAPCRHQCRGLLKPLRGPLGSDMHGIVYGLPRIHLSRLSEKSLEGS